MATTNIGTNIVATVEGNKLTLVVDLEQRNGKSSSGKTDIIATSSGNAAIPGHPGLQFGLNVFAKPKG
jgi:hypothetical protein